VSQKTTYYHPDGSVSLEKTLIVTGTNLEVRVQQLERENAALRSALDYQANYQRDLRADRDRLDWIIGKAHYLFFKELGSDLAKGREQIDAAREAQP
jgi:hypothetical protein